MARIPTITSTTSSCQPPIIKQLGSVTVRKRGNSQMKTLSGAKPCVFWGRWLVGLCFRGCRARTGRAVDKKRTGLSKSYICISRCLKKSDSPVRSAKCARESVNPWIRESLNQWMNGWMDEKIKEWMDARATFRCSPGSSPSVLSRLSSHLSGLLLLLSCLPAGSSVASATQVFSARSCYNVFSSFRLQSHIAQE